MKRRVLLFLVVAAALGGFPATAESSDSYLIQASAGFQRLGHYWISDDPTYAGALKALGKSSSCHMVFYNPSHVVAAWRPLGVTMTLATFGGMTPGETGCTAPDRIYVSTVRVGSPRWTTSLGLRVGDPVSKLKRLYRNARATKGVPHWYRRGYSLVTQYSRFLSGSEPVLVAETRDGRVRAIVFVVGAQGD
jgi:hypothetical protein